MTKKVLNFVRGAGSVLELAPPARLFSIGEGIIGRSDADALGQDWSYVGADLKKAIGRVEPVRGPSEQAKPRHGGG